MPRPYLRAKIDATRYPYVKALVMPPPLRAEGYSPDDPLEGCEEAFNYSDFGFYEYEETDKPFVTLAQAQVRSIWHFRLTKLEIIIKNFLKIPHAKMLYSKGKVYKYPDLLAAAKKAGECDS